MQLAAEERMKPGDRVIWIYSPKRSLLKGWRLQRIPGEIVRIHRQKIRIRVWMRGNLRCVNVYPENVLFEDEDQRRLKEGPDFYSESESESKWE